MKEFGKKVPLLFGILCLVIFYGGIKVIPAEGYLQMSLLRFAQSAVILLVSWPVLDKQWLEFPGGGWKSTFQLSKILIIGTILAPVLLVIGTSVMTMLGGVAEELIENADASTHRQFNQNWLPDLLGVAVFCVSVGICEEFAFRRGFFGCEMAQFAGKKDSVLWSAVISSLLFGFVHVMSSLTLDPVALVTAMLKTAETGLFGFILCGALMEGNNIWPLIAVHTIGDFITQGATVVMKTSSSVGGDYVKTSQDGLVAVATIVVYTFCILLYLPAAKKAFRILKEKEYLPEQQN